MTRVSRPRTLCRDDFSLRVCGGIWLAGSGACGALWASIFEGGPVVASKSGKPVSDDPEGSEISVGQGPVSAATAELVGSLKKQGLLTDQLAPLAASALVLAATLDAGAGLAVAAVAREHRALVAALSSQIEVVSDGFDDFLNGLSAPLRD